MGLGTRSLSRKTNNHPPGGSVTRSLNLDKGLSKNVTASLTFAAATGRVTGANGTFASTFAVGDPVMISGALLNSGFWKVTGLDGVNAAYLTLDPAPKDEGPITATIRTS